MEIAMDNAKYTPAELSIRQALTSLMKQKPFSRITVMQIAKEADVNRKTFYAYYASKQDCYLSLIREVFSALFECFLYVREPSARPDHQQIERDIRRFLEKTRRNKDALDALITEETADLAFSCADAIIMEKGRLCAEDERDIRVLLHNRLYVETVRSLIFILIDFCTSNDSVSPDLLCESIHCFMLQNASALFGYPVDS